MIFLNLTLGQFLPLIGAVAAVTIALYMLDRTRRRQVVATLRFWDEAGKPAPITRRAKIQQPLSLILQLLGMLLLLLAVAEWQYAGRTGARRDHVLVLDTSAWMGAAAPNRPNRETLMDVARSNALAWVRAVPADDRILVVRADGLATPATGWETDRRNVARAILESQPGATVLNISQSLDFARRLQKASGMAAGEIAYAGPGRIAAREANNIVLPELPAFRVLAVDDAVDNCGLRVVGARRSVTDQGVWDVLVRVRNYSTSALPVTVTLNFGNIPQGTKRLELPPGEEREATFAVRTRAAGLIEARIYPKDAFAADNYASLELPEVRSLPVLVFTDQPALLRPALASDPRVDAEFRPTSQYTAGALMTPVAGSTGKDAERKPALVILHRFGPDKAPAGSVLWIDPPAGKSPVVVKERAGKPEALSWTPDQPLTTGLRARDVQLQEVSVFTPAAKDIVLAATDKGPIMVARGQGDARTVVMGFDPFAGETRFELATPLLLANVLRWVAPDVFRDVDVATQAAGAVDSPIPAGKQEVQVLTDTGANLPFVAREKSVEFFTGDPARVRVVAGNTERVYSLTLPEMWDVKWTAPANARRGIPALNDALRRSPSLWPWLALLGAAVLLLEWFLYGRRPAMGIHAVRRGMEKAA
jgi:hypothetical protein